MDQEQDHDLAERERSRSRERENIQNFDDEERHANDSESNRWGNRGDEPLSSSRDNTRSTSNDQSSSSANLYITNLSFKTTEDSLRAAFERFGQIESIQVVKDPLTGSSRGFGFINFVTSDDGARAIEKMHEAEVDDRNIRVEKARRATGYAKTPGKYMGPPQVAAKFVRGGPGDSREDRYREYRGPPGGRGDRGGYRGGGHGGGYRGDRYPDYPRDDYPRRDPPPRYDDRRGPPPVDRYAGDRYPPVADRYAGGGYGGDRYAGRDDYPRRDGPPRYDDRRGPPPIDRGGYHDDRRPPVARDDRPPVGEYRRGPPVDRVPAYGGGPGDRHGGGRY